MSWIEEGISDVLANLPEKEILKDQWVHRIVRLVVLDRMAGSHSWKPVQARKAREEFNEELEEFLNERTWPLESPSESRKTDSVVYHYGRLNALTHLEEEALAKEYSKRLLWQSEVDGLLAPPENMGLIDAQISDWIDRALPPPGSLPNNKYPYRFSLYRELIMWKLGVHHTIGKLVSKIGENQSMLDSNARPWASNDGFMRNSDSTRTRHKTLKDLVEEMGLGTIYTDGAGRDYTYLSHRNYVSMLNVLFYSGR